MYQDKISKEAQKAIDTKPNQIIHRNIFVKAKLDPLGFIPDEMVCDATHIARDILANRSNEEVIALSKAIDSMLLIGKNLLQDLAVKLLDSSNSRISIMLTQGRALYLLCDYFDITTIEVKNTQWCEMFATLTLMQAVEINYMRSQSYENDSLSQALKLSAEHSIKELAEEIIDSIARAECMFDKKHKSTITGRKGGRSKGKRIEPLKEEVIRLYLEKYTSRSNRHAAKIIEGELIQSDSPLLELSSSEEKQVEFAKWIGQFKNGKLKFPIKD